MKFLSIWVGTLAVFLGVVRADDATNRLSSETEVTFTLDMRNATRADGTPFNPFFEGVWINGNFAGWWAWGSSPAAFQMDDPDGDGVYTFKTVLPAGSSSIVEYKYGIDSQDNEGGTNWTRVVKTVGTYSFPTDVFGRVVRETGGAPSGEVGSISIRKGADGNVILAWEGGNGIRVQQTSSLAIPAWTEVPGTLGGSTATLPTPGTWRFFRLMRP